MSNSICFTGKLDYFTRNSAQAAARENGLDVWPGVKSGLTYLVAADPNSGSSKMRKAADLGIKVISETDFMQMINYVAPALSCKPIIEIIKTGISSSGNQTAVLRSPFDSQVIYDLMINLMQVASDLGYDTGFNYPNSASATDFEDVDPDSDSCEMDFTNDHDVEIEFKLPTSNAIKDFNKHYGEWLNHCTLAMMKDDALDDYDMTDESSTHNSGLEIFGSDVAMWKKMAKRAKKNNWKGI